MERPWEVVNDNVFISYHVIIPSNFQGGCLYSSRMTFVSFIPEWSSQWNTIFLALSEGIIFGGAYLPSYGGKFAFQINRASLVVGSKFTVFALFFFVYEGNFSSTGPQGTYIWRGDLTEGFLHYWSWGLIFIWRGLDMEGLIFGILW